MFAEIPACVNDLTALELITREALQDFAAHHVAYLELRSTPKVLLTQSPSGSATSKREYIETILSVMRRFEQEENDRYQLELAEHRKCPRLPLVSRFLVSVDRSQTVEEAHENVDLAIAFFTHDPDGLVVGVDLGGNPLKQDFSLFEPCFVKARQAGLKITLHCAEVSCGADDPVQDTVAQRRAYQEAAAILAFGPDRIGHALLLPPSLLELLEQRRIPVETCPTSNVMTLELAKVAQGNLIEGLRRHPALRHWLEIQYPIVVATDDPGVFSTTATQELVLLIKAFGLKKERVKDIVTSSMDYAFCDDTTRIRIKKAMEQNCDQLRAENNAV